jgi:hypothetical protein
VVFVLIEVLLWYFSVILCFIIAIVFFSEYRSRKGFSSPFFLGIGIFAITYAIARLIENIRRYSIGTYNDIVEAWIRGEQITGINFWLRLLYYVIAWFGISTMFFNIERYILTDNRYIITIFSIMAGLVSIINYLYLNLITFWAAVIFYFICAYFISIFFINAAIKAPSKYVRNGCILVAVGIMTLATGVMIDLPEAVYFAHLYGIGYSEFLVRLIAPILFIIGLIFFTIGLKTHFREKKITGEITEESPEEIEAKLVDLGEKLRDDKE